MVQNLTWSGAYLRSTFSYALLQKVLKLVPLTATGIEVYIASMTTVLSNYYDYLEENLNHLKCLKLKNNLGENVAECCAAILVDDERFESDGDFNLKHLRHIIQTFENTSDTRFHLWANQEYKEVKDFIKKIHICDEYVMQHDALITYGSLVKEDMCEHRKIITSKRWEPTYIK